MKGTIEDREEGWYEGLERALVYKRLVDFQSKHLRRMTVCRHSKRWWTEELDTIAGRVRAGRRASHDIVGRNRWKRLQGRLKRDIRKSKTECWRGFCQEHGMKAPWEVVR